MTAHGELPQKDAHRQIRQTRICLLIILIGLLNFLAYGIGYWILWGEALHGDHVAFADGTTAYLLNPHEKEVSRGEFLYSGIHSLSIYVTVGAVMLAMLTLAKERIVSSASRTILRGRTWITVVATIITVSVVISTIVGSVRFARMVRIASPAPLAAPAEVESAQP
jgi:hypothetical protein